jgi:hypothetical protein
MSFVVCNPKRVGLHGPHEWSSDIDEIDARDGASHDPKPDPELVRQSLAGGHVWRRTDCHVGNIRDVGTEMRPQRTSVQTIVQRFNFGTALIGYEKEVGPTAYRVTNHFSPTNSERYRRCGRDHRLEFRFEEARRRVDRKHQREMHREPRGKRIVLRAKQLDPLTVAFIKAGIRDDRECHSSNSFNCSTESFFATQILPARNAIPAV